MTTGEEYTASNGYCIAARVDGIPYDVEDAPGTAQDSNSTPPANEPEPCAARGTDAAAPTDHAAACATPGILNTGVAAAVQDVPLAPNETDLGLKMEQQLTLTITLRNHHYTTLRQTHH